MEVPLPMVENPNEAGCTCVSDLQQHLHMLFDLPPDERIVGIVPLHELYSPTLPLLLLNTIAYMQQKVSGLNDCIEVFLEIQQQAPDLPLLLEKDQPLSLEAVEHILRGTGTPVYRQQVGLQIVQTLHQHGFLRLIVPASVQEQIDRAYREIRVWLQGHRTRQTKWRENIAKEDTTSTGGRFIGYSQDENRQWLQMRQYLSPKEWPPSPLVHEEEAATLFIKLFQLLDRLAYSCFILICETLGQKEEGLKLLDGYYEESCCNSATGDRYGASVLRVYNYETTPGSPASEHETIDEADTQVKIPCGVHADLGLLTVAPRATEAGLWIYHRQQMRWINVEDSMHANQFILFAGETLGHLTNGLIKAALHCVAPGASPGREETRMSMPFFLRGRPDAKLPHPVPPQPAPFSIKAFMEDIVFQQRPWRREAANSTSKTPDY